MGTYNTDRLLDDVLQERGALLKDKAPEKSHYQQVWDAFNRYVTDTLEKRQTLHVPNFCKIGWRLEQHQGSSKAKQRPHFQLEESFVRVHQLDVKQHTMLPDSQLAPMEEFNYSKAAIRYSQGLTKGQLFTGLRAIVHKIGDACSLRHPLSIDFEMGQLLCSERVAHFAFVGELYQQEGLEIPATSSAVVDDPDAEDTGYRPSCTFAPATSEGLSLNIRGTSSYGVPTPQAEEASSSQLLQRPPRHPNFEEPEVAESVAGESSLASESFFSEALDRDLASGSGVSAVSAKERVRQRMLEKHLEDVETKAAEAVNLKVREGEYHTECESKERAVADIRKAFYLDHAEQVRRQIQQQEEKRRAGRENAIHQASQHNFPCFREDPVVLEVHDYVGERKRHLKEDLDQQVSDKRLLKHVSKQRESEWMAKAIEQNQEDIAKGTVEVTRKKEAERSILAEAWERSIRLNQVRKAIDTHSMTAAKSDLPKVASGLRKNIPGLELPEQRCQTGSTSSSRPPTGLSARRLPNFGAAASLALRRDRQSGANPQSSSARRPPASART